MNSLKFTRTAILILISIFSATISNAQINKKKVIQKQEQTIADKKSEITKLENKLNREELFADSLDRELKKCKASSRDAELAERQLSLAIGKINDLKDSLGMCRGARKPLSKIDKIKLTKALKEKQAELDTLTTRTHPDRGPKNPKTVVKPEEKVVATPQNDSRIDLLRAEIKALKEELTHGIKTNSSDDATSKMEIKTEIAEIKDSKSSGGRSWKEWVGIGVALLLGGLATYKSFSNTGKIKAVDEKATSAITRVDNVEKEIKTIIKERFEALERTLKQKADKAV